MKNAGIAGGLALCGIGLVLVGLANLGTTPSAVASGLDGAGARSDSDRESRTDRSAFMEGMGPCYAPGAPVTWTVFDSQLRPLEVISGADELACWSGDGMEVDLDGDGSIELPNASFANTGVNFYCPTCEVEYIPFSVLRRIDDGVALEIVLEFPSDIQYWLDLQGLEISEVSAVYAAVRSFFDVDGDGLRDAVLGVTWARPDEPALQKYYWYRNQLTPPVRGLAGDIDGDGRVDGFDLTIVLGDWTG